jgi:HK97 family phage major capsid protein
MSKKLRELQARKTQLVESARAIADGAAKENRDMTEEEGKNFDVIMGEKGQVSQVNAAIDRENMAIRQQQLIDAETAVESSRIVSVRDLRENDPKRGFNNFGEYAKAVYYSSLQGGTVDDRLLIGAAVPGTFGSEGVGQDGGFAIPPDYAKEIYMMSLGEDSLLPLTDDVELSGNSMVFPKDETTPWGTDGIRAFWQAEATAAALSKPKIGTTTQRLHKLIALVPLTDELIDDTNALSSYLPNKVADSIRWKTNEAILFGNGNGQPAGALTSNAVITVVKESGQANLTLLPMNLAKMIARLPAGSYPRSVWLVNNDVLPALFTLTLGNYPIYIPASAGIQGNPYGSLLGRPIMISQHAQTFSAQGDVILLDLKYYRTITKAGGMQTATSMHLYFDADATAFRTTFRVDGQSKIAASITPAKGSTNLTPFVQLGAR